MSTLAAAARIGAEALVQPRQACVRLQSAPPAICILALAGVLHAALAAMQWRIASPVLERDPLFADWSVASSTGAVLQVLMVTAAPATLAARALLLGSMLNAVSSTAARRAWIAWAACAESVLWLESAASTAVAGLANPADLAALRAARLHSGLDLLWPQSAAGGWLAGINLFTVWWAVLLAIGMLHLGGTSRRRAIGIGIACGLGRVALQAMWNFW